MFMKTFEERLTAWMEGRLSGPELAAFERELDQHPEAMAETEADRRLGSLLRAHLSAPPMRNADFFNHQLLQQIEADLPVKAVMAAKRTGLFWSLRRMAFSGAFLLMLSTALYFAAVPKTRRDVRQNEQYVQNILNAKATDITAAQDVHVRSDDPNVTATCFRSKDNDVNVVWLDGLGYMPRDHKLK
jgi:hypothetical protein